MVAFSFFWIQVFWYGIFYALAFLIGYFWLAYLGKKQYFSAFPKVQYILTEGLENLIVCILLGVMIGGRLGHVLIYGEGYYIEHWKEILMVWKGGMSFIGGIFGVVLMVGAYLFYRKCTFKEGLLILDLVLVFVPLGIVLGRFGNFLNQELYGVALSSVPAFFQELFPRLGLVHVYPQVDELLRVNTNFLAIGLEGWMLFLLSISTLMYALAKKKIRIGLISANFLLFYSFVRFFIEYFRADSQLEYLGMFTKSQWFFLIFMLLALVLRFRVQRKDYLFNLD